MKDMELQFIDKSAWPRGEWDEEPDKAQWTDAATELPCLIVRNGAEIGSLCGYVGVPEGHPLFGLPYDKLPEDSEPSVHGGLTYSRFCQEDREHGICHITEPGEPDRVWWLGFDCAHAGDLCPGMLVHTPDREGSRRLNTYRTFAYVKDQCKELASQLAVTSAATLP